MKLLVKTMKIAQVTHLFPPMQGGIEHHVYSLSNELARAGHEVIVYTTKVKGAGDDEKIGFLGPGGNPGEDIITHSIRVRRFWSVGFPGFSSVRFSPGLFFALLQSDADVFAGHGYGSPMPFITSIAAFLKRKPFFFTLHGYPDLKGLGGIFQKLYKWFCASIFLRIAKKIIVVSKNSIPKIEKEIAKEKIIYVPNGVVMPRFFHHFVAGTYITYIGRLDEYKGIDRLIRAYAHLGKKLQEAYPLRIVGPDEGIKQGLVELAKKEGIGIEFLEVPYSEISKIYNESACVVLPSHYEGFSLVWLEAMAAERPMFSTPVGDAEILFKAAYGTDASRFLFKDEKELTQKLGAFLENPSAFKPAVERAHVYVEKTYSWPVIAQTTLQVYNESTK